MRQSILFRKTYNLVTEDATDSKDCISDDELLQPGVHFTAKVHSFDVFLFDRMSSCASVMYISWNSSCQSSL